MADIISNIIDDKQDVKNQLGTVPDVIPSVKRFTNSFKPKRHSVKINQATIGFGSFVLNSSLYGVLGTDELGRGGHTDSLYAIVPDNNIFEEYFHETQYIDTSNSTGTLNANGSYTLNTGEVLQSEIIAKIRQPINKVLFYSNEDLIDEEGIGMELPFSLGEDIFGGENVDIEVSNDSGVTWFNINESEEHTFATSTVNDELKYRITALSDITINIPIRIKIN